MSRSSYKRQGERRRKALKQKPFNILDVDDPRNQPRKAMKRDGDQTLLPDDMRVVPSVKLDVTMDPRAARALAIGVPARIVKAMLDNEKREQVAKTLRKGERDGSVVRYVPAIGTLGGGWPTEELITAGARATHDEVFDRLGLYKDGTIRKVLKFDDEPPRIQDRWREIARIIFNSMFPELPTA